MASRSINKFIRLWGKSGGGTQILLGNGGKSWHILVMSGNNKLVWSDDPKDQKCPRCREFLKQCQCRKEMGYDLSKVVAVFRMESGGRGGKTVTVIDRLPMNETFLKDLTKELKSKCGVGGTYKMDGPDGIVEIQGDKRVQIKALFDKKGIKYKGM